MNEESEQMKQFQAMMLWKLGLGHMGKFFNGENPLPDKSNIASKDSWTTEPMPERDVTTMQTGITVTDTDMEIIRRGHIPEAQEDHWFMYCDDEHIRYYRSWTGMCAFEAHYKRENDQWLIDSVTINHALVEFGVNGDEPGIFLFIYLLVAETGTDATPQWNSYLNAWLDNHFKYADKANNETTERPNQRRNDDNVEASRNRVIPNDNRKTVAAPHQVDPVKNEEQQDPWYIGYENHICEGCIYTRGIRRFEDDRNSRVMGCGRLFHDSFKQRYLSGKCEYKKTDLFIPSEIEKIKKEEAIRKKIEKQQEELRQYRERKRLLMLDKQDGTYERRLIKAFIEQILDGDINKLADFDFSTLSDDKTFGDSKGFAFSYDRNDIVQAIMSVAFGDLWPGLNMYTIENYTYNVAPVNHMHYIFGSNIMDQYFLAMEKFHPTKEQNDRAVKVSHLLCTIGNLWILPKRIDVDKDTYHYHGYTDLFLKAVYGVMTGKGKVNPSLKGQLYGARKEMAHLQGAEGFEKMVRGLFLDDFLDYYGKPTDVLPQVWFLMKGLSREAYFKAVDDYCSFMEYFVPKRSKRIVEKLKKTLAQENLAKKYHIEQMLEEERTNAFTQIAHSFTKALDDISTAGRDMTYKEYIFKTLDALSDNDDSPQLDRPSNKEEDFNKLCGGDFYSMIGGGKLLLRHTKVKRTAMGIWQAFLLGVASFALPVKGRPANGRTYIFCHQDLAQIPQLANEKAPLLGIRDVVSPKVKIRDNEGTIECCFWKDRKGLYRETLHISYANETVVSIKLVKEEVLYSVC